MKKRTSLTLSTASPPQETISTGGVTPTDAGEWIAAD